ncbi:MAG: DUF4363 family protein [Clostridia bacterium]|nr:DUF4363 family protein [Clostridia bacterium]
MKAFVAALVLLSVLIGGVVVGSVALYASTEATAEAAKALAAAADREQSLSEFEQNWERMRPWYMLAVNTSEIGRVDEALAEAIASNQSKSDSDYAIAVAELQEACSHIHDLVGFRIEQIC